MDGIRSVSAHGTVVSTLLHWPIHCAAICANAMRHSPPPPCPVVLSPSWGGRERPPSPCHLHLVFFFFFFYIRDFFSMRTSKVPLLYNLSSFPFHHILPFLSVQPHASFYLFYFIFFFIFNNNNNNNNKKERMRKRREGVKG